MKQSTLKMTLLTIATLACSIPPTGNNSTPTSVVQKATESANGGTPPKVVIETPSSDAQAVIAQPLTVRVHATDTIGVTRVEMRESGRVVASQPSPEPASDFIALLQYKPNRIGHINLEVGTLRQTMVSVHARTSVTMVADHT